MSRNGLLIPNRHGLLFVTQKFWNSREGLIVIDGPHWAAFRRTNPGNRNAMQTGIAPEERISDSTFRLDDIPDVQTLLTAVNTGVHAPPCLMVYKFSERPQPRFSIGHHPALPLK